MLMLDFVQTFARHINNPEPFLNAPIHMLVADNSWGGTTIVWDRPTTQLVPPGSPAAAFTACAEFDKVVSIRPYKCTLVARTFQPIIFGS